MKFYGFYFDIEPKSHADSTMFTKTGIAYKPKATKEYQSFLIRNFHCYSAYPEGTFPLSGPLLASWILYFPRIERNKKVEIYSNLFHHTKPDGDGVIKIPQDIIQVGQLSHKSRSHSMLKRLGLIENDSRLSLITIEKLYVKHNQKPKIQLILCQLSQSLKKNLPLTNVMLQALASTQQQK